MRIIILINHPAQFHFFKYTIKALLLRECKVQVLIKTKDILEQLVIAQGFDYINIQPVNRKNNSISILLAQLCRTVAVLRIARKFNPSIMLGTDASVAQAGYLLNIPVLTTLEDDIDVIPKLAKLTYPFTTKIVTPDVCRVGKWEYKKIGYNGYMKLAYLHPHYFTPKKSIVDNYVLGDKYCLIRLAKLTAHHDNVQKEMGMNSILKLIDIIQERGYTVYISSEDKIDKQLEKFKLNIDSENIHHVLYFASLLISDSQSMSMEAAMLGTPSVRFSNFAGKITVLEELEHKYQLTYGINTKNEKLLYKKVNDLLSIKNLDDLFQQRRATMLADKIDVTQFLTGLILEYCFNNE